MLMAAAFLFLFREKTCFLTGEKNITIPSRIFIFFISEINNLITKFLPSVSSFQTLAYTFPALTQIHSPFYSNCYCLYIFSHQICLHYTVFAFSLHCALCSRMGYFQKAKPSTCMCSLWKIYSSTSFWDLFYFHLHHQFSIYTPPIISVCKCVCFSPFIVLCILYHFFVAIYNKIP